MTPPGASTAAGRMAARRASATNGTGSPVGRRRQGAVQRPQPAQVVRVAGRPADSRTPRPVVRVGTTGVQSITRAAVSVGRSAQVAVSRRVSGPAMPRGAAHAAVAPAAIPARIPAGEPIGRRLALVVRHAPDLAITHRIARGRLWIGLLAAGLIAIVFLQVMLLGMNTGIGREVSDVSRLQRENAELKSEVSGLSSETRIVAEAQRMGFVEPPVGSSRFTAPGSSDVDRAAASMRAPSGGPDGPTYARASQPSTTQGQSADNPQVTTGQTPGGASATPDQPRTSVGYAPASG